MDTISRCSDSAGTGPLGGHDGDGSDASVVRHEHRRRSGDSVELRTSAESSPPQSATKPYAGPRRLSRFQSRDRIPSDPGTSEREPGDGWPIDGPAVHALPQGPATDASPAASEDPAVDGAPSIVERIREVVDATLPSGSRVLVVSSGDPRLLDLCRCQGWHFPQLDDGAAGALPRANSRIAAEHLEALREKGADYLLVPHHALWWLEDHVGFRHYLQHRYRLVIASPDCCHIYSLLDSPRLDSARLDSGRERSPLPDVQPSIWRWRQWLERRGGSPARRVHRSLRR